jgi:hypothetical protein
VPRFERFKIFLPAEIKRLKLVLKLRGGLDDEQLAIISAPHSGDRDTCSLG